MGAVARLIGGDVRGVVGLELVDGDGDPGAAVARAVQAREAVGGGDLVGGEGLLAGCGGRGGAARLRAAGDDVAAAARGSARARDREPGRARTSSGRGAAMVLRPTIDWTARAQRRGEGGRGAGRIAIRPSRSAIRVSDTENACSSRGRAGHDGDRQGPPAQRSGGEPLRAQRPAHGADLRRGGAEAPRELHRGEIGAVAGRPGRRDGAGVGGQRGRVAGAQRHRDVQPGGRGHHAHEPGPGGHRRRVADADGRSLRCGHGNEYRQSESTRQPPGGSRSCHTAAQRSAASRRSARWRLTSGHSSSITE